MSLFPKAHLWLLIPFFIAITGFYFTYWSVFTEVPFRQHGHGLTATLWYVFLIVQPYLYTKGKLNLHRQLGFVGLFIAGGVVFSVLQIIPYNLLNPNMSQQLKYGLTFIDCIVLIGFSTSVLMAMFCVKNTPKHGRWMISTVIWALVPALSRLIYFPMTIISEGEPILSFIQVIWLCLGLILITLSLMMWDDYRKNKKVYNSYIFTVIGSIFFTALMEVMGESTWWINLCDDVLKV